MACMNLLLAGVLPYATMNLCSSPPNFPSPTALRSLDDGENPSLLQRPRNDSGVLKEKARRDKVVSELPPVCLKSAGTEQRLHGKEDCNLISEVDEIAGTGNESWLHKCSQDHWRWRIIKETGCVKQTQSQAWDAWERGLRQRRAHSYQWRYE